MKKILLMVLTTFSIVTYGQNYQTIKSNQLNYFGTNSLDQILATRTDSVVMSGNDSIFYSYKAVRGNNDPEQFNISGCPYELGPNWYGSHVIIEENGTNLFFNRFNDTIRVATQSSLNEQFLVYLYPNGDSLYGTVTAIDTMTVLGNIDSVKTISLTNNNDPSISHLSFEIGKQNGFVKLFSPYSFPYAYRMNSDDNDTLSPYALVGSEYPRIGITKPHIGEIYNYEVGDRFVYSTRHGAITESGPWTKTYIERDVIDKVSYGSDSIIYTFKDTILSTNGDESWQTNPDFTTYEDIHELTVKEFNNFNDSLLPEEFNFVTQKWNELYVNSCGVLEEKYFDVFYVIVNPEPNDTCIYFDYIDSPDLSNSAINGFGITQSAGWINLYSPDNYISFNLIYYSKVNGISCGTNSYLSIEEEQKIDDSDLSIYPNPANNKVTVRFETKDVEPIEIRILTISGQTIYSQNTEFNSFSEGVNLDISDFDSGIYFVTVNSSKGNISKKLVIR